MEATNTDMIIYKKANAIYLHRSNAEELSAALSKLAVLTLKKDCTYHEDATALAYRIRLKIVLLDCVLGGFGDDAIGKAVDIAKRVYEQSTAKEYKKTAALATAVSSLLETVMLIMSGVESKFAAIVDSPGDSLRLDADACLAFAEELGCRIITVRTGRFPSVFDASFPDLQEALVMTLTTYRENVYKALRINEDLVYSTPYNRIAHVYRNEDLPQVQAYPAIFGSVDNSPLVHIVCSPFREEFQLVASAYAAAEGCSLVILELDELNRTGNKSGVIQYMTAKLRAMQNTKFAVFGILGSISIAESFLESFAEIIGSTGQNIYVFDSSPQRLVFQGLTDESLPAELRRMVTNHYLSMPTYTNVCEQLARCGLTHEADDDIAVRGMPFFGYVGLNLVLSASNTGEDWQEKLSSLSATRMPLAREYFYGLANKSLLLDSSWGEVFVDDSEVFREVRCDIGCDCSALQTYNSDNIRKILNAKNASLAEICGLLVQYCLLRGGTDTACWQELDRSVMSDRVSSATKAIARFLNVEFEPEVEVLDTLCIPGAGGLCTCGGMLIQFQYSCAQCNYEWLLGSICHEVYHSFQHTTESKGWKLWHLVELGVNKWRVEQWQLNGSQYIGLEDNINAYESQIYEADARTFAAEAVEATKKRWDELNIVKEA